MIAHVQHSFNYSNHLKPLSKVIETSEAKMIPLWNDSESQLWDHFREGDELAFGQIYRDYVNYLFNYGSKFSSDRDLVMDCVQDFFLYLREHREGLSATTSIKYYLLRSFRRRLTIYTSKLDKRKHHSTDELDFHLEVHENKSLNFIEQEAEAFMVKKLNKCLEKLCPKEREAVFFYYYEGISYKEIAEIMEFTHISSARRLIYTALSNLKVILLNPSISKPL
jgi:RNA polymerase sigma factor (sigma-70 family)